MHRLNTSFVLGYHGCSRETAERVLAGEPFVPSDNDYDWLGPGIYFWQANPARAIQFATEKAKRERSGWVPTVIGAVIDMGLCLDLSSEAGIRQVKAVYPVLVETYKIAGWPLPRNSGGKDIWLRKLDCAVIRMLHDVRKTDGEDPIDSVSGIFIEGEPIYSNSGFHEKTHVQICVCNPEMIKGVFRMTSSDLLG